jgi:hypothetical protein
LNDSTVAIPAAKQVTAALQAPGRATPGGAPGRNAQLEHRDGGGERGDEQENEEGDRRNRPQGMAAKASGRVTNTRPDRQPDRARAQTRWEHGQAGERRSGIGKYGHHGDLTRLISAPAYAA